MKLAFFKPQEFETLLCELINADNTGGTCNITYSEEMDCDVVEVYQGNVHTNTIPIHDLLPRLSEHLNISIINYDVIEVGDYGEGFVFFF